MSIHTILLQEIDKIAAKGLELSDNDLWKYYRGEEFFDDLRSFATRIVEEVKREERERIIKLQKEVEDKKWIDAEHCSCLAYAIDIIENPDSDRIFLASNKSTGTKLQKMKG